MWFRSKTTNFQRKVLIVDMCLTKRKTVNSYVHFNNNSTKLYENLVGEKIKINFPKKVS